VDERAALSAPGQPSTEATLPPDRVAAKHSTPRASRQLAKLCFDIGAPIAVYYLLHAAGAASLVALAAGAAVPAAGSAWTLAVRRRADPVALVMVASFTASILVSVIAHDPRFLLAKDGLITGVWGLWFMATVRGTRPAAYIFGRPLMEALPIYTAGSWDVLWETEPEFRRIWRVSTVIWGTGLLADAAVRVLMSYTLPVNVVPALGGALWPVTFVVLQVVTNIYYEVAGLNRLLGARWQRRQPWQRGARFNSRSGTGPG
jgi:hypothetical protein